MPKDKAKCGKSKAKIDKLAQDALAALNKVKKEDLPRELRTDVQRAIDDLKAIKSDNHRPN